MNPDISSTFTGLNFVNPFLLASGPPTESEANIMKAFEAGWGGVVTKTIALHPVVNVAGARTIFMHAANEAPDISREKTPGSVLHSSWNWELTSTKPLKEWGEIIRHVKQAYPDRIVVASIMAGFGGDELDHWRELAMACQEAGADALELNMSCPHMDRADMGAHVGQDKDIVELVTRAVTDVVKIPVWNKLTPATANITHQAEASFRGGAAAISSSNTFKALPLINAESLEFEINVDGQVSTGGLGGPAILPLALAKMSELTQAFPDKEFSGIGGISRFNDAFNYMALGCGTVQICTAAMLDHKVGPHVIKELKQGLSDFLARNADKGWNRIDDFKDYARKAIVPQSQIKRPNSKAYNGGYDDNCCSLK